MNILLLSPWFPSPPFGGALIRVHETVRHLSHQHRLTLLAPVASPPAPQHLSALTDLCARVVAVPVSETALRVLGRLAKGVVQGMPLIQSLHHHAALVRQVRRLTLRDAYDVIHVEHSFMTPYLAAVSQQSRPKRVLTMHNIESLRFRRELSTMRWSARRLALLADQTLFGSWEEKSIQQFDGIVTMSGIEEQWARAHAPGAQIAVVPNGVDTEYFSPRGLSQSPRTIVFTGLMNYPPNVDAAVWFCDAILPLVAKQHADLRFLIVGDKPTAQVLALARKPHVEVAGRVPDVRPYLERCTAVVVPLRSGAGTRLKILEAMAMQRAVVSTPQGAEGLDVTNGVNILLADTPSQFADHLCRLIKSAEVAEQLGHAGRQLVERGYDWRSCFKNLDGLYQAVTDSGHCRELGPVREIAS